MRILFISGTAGGGATISTRELADRLASRGHTVGMLLRRRPNDVGLTPGSPARTVRDLSLRAVRVLERSVVRRPRGPVAWTHGPMWTGRHLEAVAPRVMDLFGPDVTVVNSVHARAWAALRRYAAERGTPTVLYVREESSVHHVAGGEVPELVVSNAHSHADAIARFGIEAVVVPSVVDIAKVQVTTSRSKVLYISPIPSRGLETAIAIARARPDLQFVFQESHRLRAGDVRVLAKLLRGIGNVTLRRYTADRPSVYRDAAVLLVPYTVNNRPRVVLEAQANGIPVVAADLSGLDECVGPGGLLVAPDGPPDAWLEALAAVIDDPDHYAVLVEAARVHARRDEVDPDALVDRFEAALVTIENPAHLTAR